MQRHELAFYLRPGLALFGESRGRGPLDTEMAFSAHARRNLLFCIFLVGVSDPRADRPKWHLARWRLSSGSRTYAGTCAAILVRTHAAVVVEWIADADSPLLGRDDCFVSAFSKRLAARDAGCLFYLFPVFCECGRGFFRISVGWHVVGGGIYFVVLRATETTAWVGSDTFAVVGQLIPAAMGMVSDLL
jgi:hypothetical protein